MHALKIKIIQPWRQLAVKSKKACFARARLRKLIYFLDLGLRKEKNILFFYNLFHNLKLL